MINRLKVLKNKGEKMTFQCIQLKTIVLLIDLKIAIVSMYLECLERIPQHGSLKWKKCSLIVWNIVHLMKIYLLTIEWQFLFGKNSNIMVINLKQVPSCMWKVLEEHRMPVCYQKSFHLLAHPASSSIILWWPMDTWSFMLNLTTLFLRRMLSKVFGVYILQVEIHGRKFRYVVCSRVSSKIIKL